MSCQGGGQIHRQAGTASAPARAQPANRAGMADGGWATASASTKVSRAAVPPVTAAGLITPAKITANPTTAMTRTAATGWLEQRVPAVMNTTPTPNRPR